MRSSKISKGCLVDNGCRVPAAVRGLGFLGGIEPLFRKFSVLEVKA